MFSFNEKDINDKAAFLSKSKDLDNTIENFFSQIPIIKNILSQNEHAEVLKIINSNNGVFNEQFKDSFYNIYKLCINYNDNLKFSIDFDNEIEILDKYFKKGEFHILTNKFFLNFIKEEIFYYAMAYALRAKNYILINENNKSIVDLINCYKLLKGLDKYCSLNVNEVNFAFQYTWLLFVSEYNLKKLDQKNLTQSISEHLDYCIELYKDLNTDLFYAKDLLNAYIAKGYISYINKDYLTAIQYFEIAYNFLRESCSLYNYKDNDKVEYYAILLKAFIVKLKNIKNELLKSNANNNFDKNSISKNSKNGNILFSPLINSKIVDIKAGSQHLLCLLENKKVVCLYDTNFNHYSQNVRQWQDIDNIYAGHDSSMAISEDGKVLYTGNDDYKQGWIDTWNNIIDIKFGFIHSLGLTSDGKVLAAGSNEELGMNVADWEDIVSIDCSNHSIGLKKDGTVLASGKNRNGECNVSNWKDIKSIAVGMSHSVGLTNEGKVIACGSNNVGQCNVQTWVDIHKIYAKGNYTIGLKKDGSILITGSLGYGRKIEDIKKRNEVDEIYIANNLFGDPLVIKYKNNSLSIISDKIDCCNYLNLNKKFFKIAIGDEFIAIINEELQLEVLGNIQLLNLDTKNIKSIKSGKECIIILYEDGTVKPFGTNPNKYFNTGDWSNITSIDYSNYHVVGLTNDGLVVATGDNSYGQCNVNEWKGIAKVITGLSYTVALKEDGTVIAVGNNKNGQCNVDFWSNIIDIKTCDDVTIGLKSDGSILYTGENDTGWLKRLNNLTDVVSIATTRRAVMCLFKDGKIRCIDNHEYYYTYHITNEDFDIIDTFKWDNIIKISSNKRNFIALNSSGQVLTTDNSKYDVFSWTNIKNIDGTGQFIIGYQDED